MNWLAYYTRSWLGMNCRFVHGKILDPNNLAKWITCTQGARLEQIFVRIKSDHINYSSESYVASKYCV